MLDITLCTYKLALLLRDENVNSITYHKHSYLIIWYFSDRVYSIFSMARLPSFLLVENVRGFESSETRNIYVEFLTRNNYAYQEYLLTPLQFGIPNSRLRYYCIAKHISSVGSFCFRHQSDQVSFVANKIYALLEIYWS